MTIQNKLSSLNLDFIPVQSNKNNVKLSGLDLSHLDSHASSLNGDISDVSSLSRKNNKPFQKINTPVNDNSPNFNQVRKGNVLENGDQGKSVKELQTDLRGLGYNVNSTGYFGHITKTNLKKFQKDHGITQTGRLGATTLKILDKVLNSSSIINVSNPNNISSTKISKPTKIGIKLANSAKNVAVRRDSYGWCYAGVATAVSHVFGDILYGHSAYQAAGILSKNSKFKEIRVNSSTLPKLSAGSIVVWGKTGVSPNGHISVALGNGKEASDHVTSQLTSLRGYKNFRVFVPLLA